MTDTIGHRIQLVRKNTGLSQVVFAKSLDLSQGFLSNLEKGRYQPTPEILIRITIIYHIDANWLLIGTGEMKPDFYYKKTDGSSFTGEVKSNYELDKATMDIVGVLHSLDIKAKQDVLKYAEERKLLAGLTAEKQRKAE